MTARSERGLLFRIAGALLLLLAITVGLAFVDLRPFNMVAALTIASIKAALVIWFFMEVRHSGHLVWIVSSLTLLWLFILMSGTIADYVTRGTIQVPANLFVESSQRAGTWDNEREELKR